MTLNDLGGVLTFISRFSPNSIALLAITSQRLKIYLLCFNVFRCTAEGLRAISLQRGQFDPKFQVEGGVPHHLFYTDSWANEFLVTMSLTVFTQRNFVTDFLQPKCDCRGKTAVLHCEPPFGGLGGNVR